MRIQNGKGEVGRGAQPRPKNQNAGMSVPPSSTALQQALVQPEQRRKAPPCGAACASGADVRGWIALVAQRKKLGLSDANAYTQAWNMVTAVNPFPATLGRICPHPCEAGCNRRDKDGAVSINALERFLGDWGLRRKLKLPLAESGTRSESVGVIGAGPAGLSFAYQLARRGYRVTVYEKQDQPGGMLYFGIPQYRLPEAVLGAEIRRILDLGVELRLNTAIGPDISVQQLSELHHVVFIGIGAGVGLKLGIPGEDDAGVWTCTDFLSEVNRGKTLELGAHVVVVGGGNTAMDAARAARRTGAQVTMLYRRTRNEMPAIETEIDDALAEGVEIAYLAAPLAIGREDGRVQSVRVQRMELGEPDGSGRRKPVPVSGSEHDVRASAVIAAVSQEPDWNGLGELYNGKIWIQTESNGAIGAGFWAGGDALGLGIAGLAIAQGRQAAEALHAQLRGLPTPPVSQSTIAASASAKPDYYPPKARSASPYRDVQSRLAQADLEIQQTISERAFLEEVSRCFSCGSCFGCEQCYMFCNAGGFSKLQEVGPGRYFALSLDCCEACGKCIELCPCGYLSPCPGPRACDS
ncbi:MAG: FAD-dependent oxidoreductase [Betaproteobacteria bacterium]|nr:FAD-dependent oxidoreductase [Betaproteobacteria bacterium]